MSSLKSLGERNSTKFRILQRRWYVQAAVRRGVKAEVGVGTAVVRKGRVDLVGLVDPVVLPSPVESFPLVGCCLSLSLHLFLLTSVCTYDVHMNPRLGLRMHDVVLVCSGLTYLGRILCWCTMLKHPTPERVPMPNAWIHPNLLKGNAASLPGQSIESIHGLLRAKHLTRHPPTPPVGPQAQPTRIGTAYVASATDPDR